MLADKNGVLADTQKQSLSRLHNLVKELLADIEATLDRCMPKLPPILGLITVDTTPHFTLIPRKGYRTSQLFLMDPTQLVFTIPGIGQFTCNTLFQGWIDVSLPQGSSVALVSKQSTRVLYRLHN